MAQRRAIAAANAAAMVGADVPTPPPAASGAPAAGAAAVTPEAEVGVSSGVRLARSATAGAASASSGAWLAGGNVDTVRPASPPSDIDSEDEGPPAPGTTSASIRQAIAAAGGTRGRTIIKTVTAAVVLFVLGSVMLWLGVRTLPNDRDRAIGMLVTGSLAFIPGSYACWVLVGACMRWPGYSYDQLPSYDD
jgi:hypothetical protein